MGFPKPSSRLLAVNRVRVARLSLSKAVKRAVKERDGGLCRVCEKPGSETHELTFRSLGGRVALENSIYVCHRCHRRLQEHRILVMGNNANGHLTFVER
jgi:5-methylcytosine-specific restriction endonuclease McrA